jgi:ubiquinone biosynthesis protein
VELRAAAREIDLAERPARGVVWLARVVAREVQIAFWLAVAALALPVFRLRRGSWTAALGAATAFLFERLGATFIKIGQIMSTRPDVFPPEFLAPLALLQDRVRPFPFADVRNVLEEEFGGPLEATFAEISAEPVASASVAQVHRARLRDRPDAPAVVAVKIRRPGIVRRAYLDEAILRAGARLVTWIPTASLVSPVESIDQFCRAVNLQLDFRIEAANNRTFRRNFAGDPHVVFPALVDDLCTDRVLVMEFVEGVKDDDLAAVGSDPAFLARKGIEIICRMIYHHGFVHADLHPGNVLYLSGNRFALLDLGLVARLDDEARRTIAEINFYMAAGKGKELAALMGRDTPWPSAAAYTAFERDVADYVSRVHGRPLEELQITALIGAIFNLLRRHRVRARADFTVVNIALMVVEGIGRRFDPSLNPSLEALPWLHAALYGTPPAD